MTYGENFKNLRKQKGLTQKYVAEQLDIHQSNVSDWENDKSRPEYERLERLCEIYDVSLYELLMIKEPTFR